MNIPFTKILIFILFLGGIYFLFDRLSVTSHGSIVAPQAFEVSKGDGVFDIANKLQDAHIIAWSGYFKYQAWKMNVGSSLLAGKYQLRGDMTTSEIIRILSKGEVVSNSVTIVFPEGFDSVQMSERLTAKALPGDIFLELVKHPNAEWRQEYWFLKDIPLNASLEGFLFPDTYTFTQNASAESIIKKMLSNFDKKTMVIAKDEKADKSHTFYESIIMASIVEEEVKTEMDRRMVADLFWRRIAIGQRLQSDATVKYVRGESKIQHSFEETRVESPYNTYTNNGLPPGPITNPGLESIIAAFTPEPNTFMYFLNDASTGETVFSETFEEHVANKAKHGL